MEILTKEIFENFNEKEWIEGRINDENILLYKNNLNLRLRIIDNKNILDKLWEGVYPNIFKINKIKEIKYINLFYGDVELTDFYKVIFYSEDNYICLPNDDNENIKEILNKLNKINLFK